MRTIYIDSEYKCHVADNGAMRSVETEFFDGKCTVFVEGYRFVPEGETWEREDGVKFENGMITPWKNYIELDAAQREYERELLLEYAEALRVMGVNV